MVKNNLRNVAIIPARSGSKRVPDKNIIDFMGKPLMAYTIEAALESEVFEEIIVSTDSEEYADIALKYGAKVPFLREECNDDYCILEDVMNYVLRTLKTKFSKEYDNYASLQVSCPLRGSQIIKDVYDEFVNQDLSSIATCFPFNFINPWWAFKLREDGNADFLLSRPSQSRSQDNEQLYCPTGAVYFSTAPDTKKSVIKHKYFPIDWKYAVDIDNYEDIEMAKAIYLMLEQDKNKINL